MHELDGHAMKREGSAPWLLAHLFQAYAETPDMREELTANPDVALFAPSFVAKARSLPITPPIDLFFQGAINNNPSERNWVVEFAREHFTVDSLFCDTSDAPANDQLDDWDYTGRIECRAPFPGLGYMRGGPSTPVQDRGYWSAMRRATFALCPAGREQWSFRTYEALMCDAIPIVIDPDHIWRTTVEQQIGFEYVLADDWPVEADPHLVLRNRQRFHQWHMLESPSR